MNRRIFLDEHLNSALEKNGFVKLRFFEPLQLSQAYKQLSAASKNVRWGGYQHDEIKVSYHSTFFENSRAYKEAVFQIIAGLFDNLLKTHLVNYQLIQTNLFNKQPGTGYVCPHQNLTTVDETKFVSLSIWAPLQATTINNGTLCFVPGSHQKISAFRNHNIKWEPLSVLPNFEDYNMVPVEMSVGDVLIFDDRIVHGSPDNNSAQNRLVLHALAIPQEAQPVYCRKNTDEIHVIEVADTFWRYFTPGEEEPTGPVIKTVKPDTEQLSAETILKFLSS